jgi:hypothetical protein
LLSLGPQEPVGVRDDSNPQHCSIHRCEPNVRLTRSHIPRATSESRLTLADARFFLIYRCTRRAHAAF